MEHGFAAALERRQEQLRARGRKVSAEIIEKLQAVSPEAARAYPSLRRVIVFGSVARERATDASDVDVLVEGIRAEDYFPLRRLLCDALQREVDLHTDTEPAAFVDKVRSRGRCVYEGRR